MNALVNPVSESIFDLCRTQREADATRRNRVAERVRAVAQELGAVRGANDGAWQLQCPHCNQITFIAERTGDVFTRRPANGATRCAAAAAIGRRVWGAI